MKIVFINRKWWKWCKFTTRTKIDSKAEWIALPMVSIRPVELIIKSVWCHNNVCWLLRWFAHLFTSPLTHGWVSCISNLQLYRARKNMKKIELGSRSSVSLKENNLIFLHLFSIHNPVKNWNLPFSPSTCESGNIFMLPRFLPFEQSIVHPFLFHFTCPCSVKKIFFK